MKVSKRPAAKAAAPKTTVMKPVMKAVVAMKKPTVRTRKVAPAGKSSKANVFSGKFEKTESGLKKSQLTKNKEGKIVSKKMQAIGKKAYKNVKMWTEACQKAKAELGLTGFVAVKKGTSLYARVRKIFDASK